MIVPLRALATEDSETSRPTLRDYQSDLHAEINDAFESGAKRVILCGGTGSGKTISAGGLLRGWLDFESELVIGWLVHTVGLRRQAGVALRKWEVPSIDWSTVAPRRREWRPGRVHAFGAAMNLPRMLPKAKTVLVVDECHRSAAPTVAKQVEHPRWQWVLGLSGTPARRGWPDYISESHALFAKQWDVVVCAPPLAELVEMGALAKVILDPRHDAGGDRSILRDDKMRESGYSASSETEFERSLSIDAAVRIVSSMPPRPSIWFCSTARGARRLGRLLARSAVILAETTETARRNAYDSFIGGTLEHLISVGVLVEGADLPNASRVVLLRPSKSRPLLAQMCGRGMRPPGDVEIIDFARSFAALGSHPLDDLPWHETLSGRVPNVPKWSVSKPKVCPTPGCETKIGPRNGRLCPNCFAEVGRWCVACERALVNIEDRAHRRCRECAVAERALHARWANANHMEPLPDRDAADDLRRIAAEMSETLEVDQIIAQAAAMAVLDQRAEEIEVAAHRTQKEAALLHRLVSALRGGIDEQQTARTGSR